MDDLEERAKWPERPHVGDTVETLPGDGPRTIGRVVATFYSHGYDGSGMHVAWDGAVMNWASCHRVALVTRAQREGGE